MSDELKAFLKDHVSVVIVGDEKPTPAMTKSGHRPLSVIAAEIQKDWNAQGTGVNYAARPYLAAMRHLDDITGKYYEDSASSVVAYFLANAQKWRGEKARDVKKELNAMLRLLQGGR